jgi:hypothetical protein
MDWKRLADRAKQVVDKRGGPQSVKEDAEELLDIAKNRDSTSDKFKEAVEAIKEPGAEPHEAGNNPPPPPQNTPQNPPETGSSG